MLFYFSIYDKILRGEGVIMFKKILQNDIYKKHRELILMAIDLFIVCISVVDKE